MGSRDWPLLRPTDEGRMVNDLDAKRAARRAAMPITTALLDEYAEFSPTVIYAEEGGRTFGKKPSDENAFQIPQNYCAPVGGWK